MKTIARMVVRDEGDGTARLGLMSILKSQNFFKPGKVYEFQEILGEILITEVGDSWIKENKLKNGKIVCWYDSVNDLLHNAGNLISLTDKEFDSLSEEELEKIRFPEK